MLLERGIILFKPATEPIVGLVLHTGKIGDRNLPCILHRCKGRPLARKSNPVLPVRLGQGYAPGNNLLQREIEDARFTGAVDAFREMVCRIEEELKK